MVNQMTRCNNRVKIRGESSAQTISYTKLKEAGRFKIIIIISRTDLKTIRIKQGI